LVLTIRNIRAKMFKISKTFDVSASHSLNLDYLSPCMNLHGHNWKITVFCKSAGLNNNGMVVDFSEIKKIVHAKMDHVNLNDVFDFNPTAENIARWITENVPYCYRTIVQESENNMAEYEI